MKGSTVDLVVTGDESAHRPAAETASFARIGGPFLRGVNLPAGYAKFVPYFQAGDLPA